MKNPFNNKRFSSIYDTIMVIVSIIAVILVSVQILELKSSYLKKYNMITIGIFTFDYIFRLYFSEDKKKFIKNNIVDLIAIIPIYNYFILLRIVSVFLRFRKRIMKFIEINNFNYFLGFMVVFICLGAFAIHFAEGISIADSVWWVFVTLTTVGYGDVTPKTILGRIIAVLLMLIGIGFISMLTSTISAYFVQRHKQKNTYRNHIITDIRNRLDNFEDLSEQDIEDIYIILKTLKNKE